MLGSMGVVSSQTDRLAKCRLCAHFLNFDLSTLMTLTSHRCSFAGRSDSHSCIFHLGLFHMFVNPIGNDIWGGN